MQKFKKVMSSADEVKPIETDLYHVYVNSGIKRVSEPPQDEEMESGFEGWEIEEQIIYDKDEFITQISKENAELSETLVSIMTEVLPNIGKE